MNQKKSNLHFTIEESYTMPATANTEMTVEEDMETYDREESEKIKKESNGHTKASEATDIISDEENDLCAQEYQHHMNEYQNWACFNEVDPMQGQFDDRMFDQQPEEPMDSACFNDIDPMQGQFEEPSCDQQLEEFEEPDECIEQEECNMQPREPFMPRHWVSYKKPDKKPFIANRIPRVPKENKNCHGYKDDGAWDVRDRFDRGYVMSDNQTLNHVVNVHYKYLSRVRNKYPVIAYETFNVEKVKHIIANHELYHTLYGDAFKPSTINKLKKLLVLAPNGYLKTYYQYSTAYRTSSVLKSRSGNGRLFALNFIGLQNLKREVRAEICLGIMCEVDLENCHFRIIARISGQFDIKLPVIMDYINNREDRLQELIALNPGKTRSDIKETLLAILNGGKQKMEELHHNQFIVDLYNECIDLRDAIVQKDPELYHEFERINNRVFKKRWDAWIINENTQGSKKYGEPWKKNAVASTLSHYLLSEESRIIEQIRAFYEEKGIIKNDGYMNCFDGIYLPYDTDGEIERLVPELEELMNKDDTSGVRYIVKMKNVDSPMFDNDTGLRSEALKATYWGLTKNGYNKDVKCGGFNRRMNVAKGFCKSYRKKIGLGLTTATLKLRQKYLPAYMPLMRTADILCVRSIMGSGKTYNTYKMLDEMIAENDKLRVLIVSFRRTIEKKYGDDLRSRGFENYEDIDGDHGYKSEEHPRLIVQINSLRKVTGEFDVLILDEVSYTVDTIFGHCEDKEKVYRNLKCYIRDTKKLLFLDAYLTDANVNYIKAVRPESPMIVMENRKTKDIGRSFSCDYGQFLSRITTKLEENKKIVVVSTSKNFVNNRLKALLDDKFTGTDKKYLLITSDAIPNTTKSEQDEIRNKKNWGKYDVVAYTPTVTAGISYEEEGVFDTIFGYFNNKSASADIAAQMLFRVRHPICRDYTLFFKESGDEGKYDTSDEGIKAFIHKYIILGDKFLNDWDMSQLIHPLLEYDPTTRQYTDEAQYQLLIDWFRKRHNSYNNFGAMLLYYLDVQGYPWSSYDISGNEFVQTQINMEENTRIMKEAAVLKIKADHKEYLEAPDITYEEMHELLDKERKTTSDKISLVRYVVDKLLGDKILEQVFENKPKELQAVIRNKTNLYMDRNDIGLLGLKGKDLSDAVFERIGDNVTIDKSEQHKQDERDFWLRKYIALMAAKGMGFDNHSDYTTTLFAKKKEENTRELKDMDIEGLLDTIKEHDDVMSLLFGNRSMEKWEEEIRNYKVTTINALLRPCGRKVVINGSEVRLIPLFTPLTEEEAPHLHQTVIKSEWMIRKKKRAAERIDEEEEEKKKIADERKEARRIRRNKKRVQDRKKKKEEEKRKRKEEEENEEEEYDEEDKEEKRRRKEEKKRRKKEKKAKKAAKKKAKKNKKA
ncbi:MAG: hypothetical protein GY804_00480 [Alphaproteobacteria bacterium]|nr:hypothetical protein [Alphaproteobacteria bacterium]